MQSRNIVFTGKDEVRLFTTVVIGLGLLGQLVVQYLRLLGARQIIAVDVSEPRLLMAYKRGNREGLDDQTGAEITAEGLSRVAGVAEEAGVTLVMELLNSKVDHKDYQCERTAWGIEVCQMVNSPRVKLLYDIYHMQIMEGDIIRTIRDHHASFAHYHTAGNPGRHELDETQELYYPPIIRAILATGYQGYLGQEFIPKGDPIAALKQAFDLCNVSL
jgi:hydroxypyruvate isomerase